jgi:alpha-ketoglutarate-dependent taurine dioxygenase
MATLSMTPLTRSVGALVEGIELREALDADTVGAVREAVLDRGVLFFRGQDISREEMLAFMERFGTPCTDPFAVVERPPPALSTVIDNPTLNYRKATAVWHTDSSLAEAPASLMSLRALELPPVGGDTCWGSMYAAYDALSEPLRNMLDGLTAVHSAFKVLPLMKDAGYPALKEDMRNVHPVVRVHPETGRKALFVNELWTEKIVELEDVESRHLLAMLFEHIASPLFTVRWRWQVNDVAFWDNRAFQHYAVRDYDEKRVMQKSLLAGDRPYGPN